MNVRRTLPAIALAVLFRAGQAHATTDEAGARARPGAFSHDHLELGADLGFVYRPKEAGAVHEQPGVAYGAHLQILAAPWLRITPYYLFARQSISFDRGALGTPPTTSLHTDDALTSYVLGLRVQPTYSPLSRLHLWLSAGAGWGTTSVPAIRAGAPRATELAPRDGVWMEIPFGVGGVFDLIPQWMGVGLDAVWGPTFAETGSAFDTVQSVDASGAVVHASAMPRWSSSLTVVAGLTLKL